MKAVGSRVDALTLAYRVTLDPAFAEELRVRGDVARKHGRASFAWKNRVPQGLPASGPRDVVRLGGLRARWADEAQGDTEYATAIWGELKFSRAAKVWNIVNEPYFRIHVDANAPGAEERVCEETGERTKEGGWTIEIVFYAQWLADVGLDAAIREAEAIASLCGEVHEQRVRRVDVCADIAGWTIREGDVRRLVKRPHAEWAKEYDNGDMVKLGGARDRVRDFGRGALERRRMTGLSVGMGGALMARIYDKRCELEKDRNGDRRATEEARWTSQGWDGQEPVTRVEFQLRGTVLHELGLRDPEVAYETELDVRGRPLGHRKIATVPGDDGLPRVLGLVDRLDHVWRTCLDWIRIVKLKRTASGKLMPVSRLPDDARWAFLRTVQFADVRAEAPIRRFRSRAAASSAQGLGVALSQAARDGQLSELSEDVATYASDPTAALEALRRRVTRIKMDEALRIVEWLLDRCGDAAKANVHLAVRNNAAMARFRPRRAPARETGPPRVVIAA